MYFVTFQFGEKLFYMGPLGSQYVTLLLEQGYIKNCYDVALSCKMSGVVLMF